MNLKVMSIFLTIFFITSVANVSAANDENLGLKLVKGKLPEEGMFAKFQLAPASGKQVRFKDVITEEIDGGSLNCKISANSYAVDCYIYSSPSGDGIVEVSDTDGNKYTFSFFVPPKATPTTTRPPITTAAPTATPPPSSEFTVSITPEKVKVDESVDLTVKVVYSDGTPVEGANVTLFYPDETVWNSTLTDDVGIGKFEFTPDVDGVWSLDVEGEKFPINVEKIPSGWWDRLKWMLVLIIILLVIVGIVVSRKGKKPPEARPEPSAPEVELHEEPAEVNVTSDFLKNMTHVDKEARNNRYIENINPKARFAEILGIAKSSLKYITTTKATSLSLKVVSIFLTIFFITSVANVSATNGENLRLKVDEGRLPEVCESDIIFKLAPASGKQVKFKDVRTAKIDSGRLECNVRFGDSSRVDCMTSDCPSGKVIVEVLDIYGNKYTFSDSVPPTTLPPSTTQHPTTTSAPTTTSPPLPTEITVNIISPEKFKVNESVNLTVRVTYLNGTPVSGANITLFDPDEAVWNSTLTDAAGIARFEFTPDVDGQWILEVEGEKFHPINVEKIPSGWWDRLKWVLLLVGLIIFTLVIWLVITIKSCKSLAKDLEVFSDNSIYSKLSEGYLNNVRNHCKTWKVLLLFPSFYLLKQGKDLRYKILKDCIALNEVYIRSLKEAGTGKEVGYKMKNKELNTLEKCKAFREELSRKWRKIYITPTKASLQGDRNHVT